MISLQGRTEGVEPPSGLSMPFQLYSIQSHLPLSGYTEFGEIFNQTPSESEQEEGGFIKANATRYK
uniref:Uncharacterized protein n=1 Tax=Cucumis melo TaxID=3656 RepID=A0A9I9EBK3_CUCME